MFNCVRNHGGVKEAGHGGGRAQGVYRRFGQTMVLAGLDLRVDEGKLYEAIGPNGAGKTTALRVAWGSSRPTPARSGCSAATHGRPGPAPAAGRQPDRGPGCPDSPAASTWC